VWGGAELVAGQDCPRLERSWGRTLVRLKARFLRDEEVDGLRGAPAP